MGRIWHVRWFRQFGQLAFHPTCTKGNIFSPLFLPSLIVPSSCGTIRSLSYKSDLVYVHNLYLPVLLGHIFVNSGGDIELFSRF